MAGIGFCEDDAVMRVFGSDVTDENIVFGGLSATPGSVHGGDGSVPAAGYAYGGDDAEGKVIGGDERAG